MISSLVNKMNKLCCFIKMTTTVGAEVCRGFVLLERRKEGGSQYSNQKHHMKKAVDSRVNHLFRKNWTSDVIDRTAAITE